MHKELTVRKADLNKTTDEWEYLYVILDKYFKLQDKEPDKIVDNFNNDQHALSAYTVLDSQVSNGGFIQLIFNGYGGYIFESPLIETLKTWGLHETAELLEKVAILYKETGISQKEGDSLENFSKLYTDYPEFEQYDDYYYTIHDEEAKRIKTYVENHINTFITVE